MTCATDADLEAFVEGELDPEGLARVERALDECAHCRRRLGQLARSAEGRADTPDQAGRALDADVFEPGPDPHLGAVLGGRYRVLRRLGSGGMGAVYEAEHELIGRRVALKLLHPELARRREVLQRFRNEARAAGAIGHPGIVQALDVGRTEAGAPFLVLELLRGRDLEAELAARGPLPLSEALEITTATADALAAAHALEIVHRDLKPANVFLCEDGTVKVLDFGISKVRGALQTSDDTGSGMLLGTPAYMAPEQLMDARRADARSDVYAVGAMLYRCLTGELPRSAASLPALLAAILTDPVPSARARRPEVAPELDLLIARALAAEPETRPATMAELRDALRSVAASTSRRSSVRPLGASERRAVVALIVEGPRDREAIERLVRDAGGRVLPRAEEDVWAMMGDESWSFDVVARAAQLALELSAHAARALVGPASLCAGALELSDELRALIDAEASEGAHLAASLSHATLEGIAVDARGALARRAEAALELPLIGRAAELAQLEEALAAAFDEARASVAWIGGEPGIGKSRLLSVLEAQLKDRGGVRILACRARARERSSDLGLIGAMVLAFAGLDARAGEPLLRAAIDALLSTAGASPEHAPFLLALIGVPGERLDAQGGDPDGDRGARRGPARVQDDEAMQSIRRAHPVPEHREPDRLSTPPPFALSVQPQAAQSKGARPRRPSTAARCRAQDERVEGRPVDPLLRAPVRDPRVSGDRARIAALEVLEGLARHRPLAIVVDDAQWADPASLEVLGQLLLRLEGTGVLVALAARDELEDRAPAWLADPEAARIRPRALRRHESARLLRALLDEEKAASLAERLHAHTGGNPLFLEQLARALRNEPEVAHLPLPPTVEGAIQARLDGLDSDAREVLKRAAVLGEAFTTRELEGLGVEGVEPLVARLIERELLREAGAEGGLARYELRTPLVAEVAYRMLDDASRGELHRLAAALLEGRAPLDVLALHFERGGLPERAARAYGEAALEAKRAGDASRTIACAERAMELAAAPPLEVRVALAEAYETRGRLADQERVLAEVERGVEGAPRAASMTERAVALQRLGRSSEALELLERAVEEAERAGDPVVYARALGKRSAALVYAGRTQEAADSLSRAERLVLTSAGELRAEAAVWRGQLAGATGDLGEQRNAYWAAVELYGALGDLRRQAGAAVNLADVYNRVGAHDEAIPALKAALDGCKRVGMRVMEGYAWANLGYAQLGHGERAAARASLEQAERIAAEVGEERLALAARLYRAKLELACDRASDAAALAAAVAVSARERGLPGLEALACCVSARAHLSAGDAEGALSEAEHALALSDELGGVEEEGGELFCVLGDALFANGRREDAARARARGRATIEAAAGRIGDRHWRERFVNDVAAHRALLEHRSA